MTHVYPMPVDDQAHQQEDGGRRQRRDERRSDWRFSVLADFEDLVRSYGQDHVSLPGL